MNATFAKTFLAEILPWIDEESRLLDVERTRKAAWFEHLSRRQRWNLKLVFTIAIVHHALK